MSVDPLFPSVGREGLNVLHIEDDPHIADVVQFVLTEQRQLPVRRVMHAANRAAALRALIDYGPHDIVLLDHNLPDCTGLELLEDISLHAPELTTLMVTAHTDVEVGIQALELGATSFLRKDELTPSTLMEKIRLAMARKRFEKGLWSMAYADPVTGLSNRRGLEMSFHITEGNAGAGDDSLVLALVDLNGFKQVNDTLGHATGDRVLREFAGQLRSTFRHTDTVARTGGDEFVVMGLSDGVPEPVSTFQERVHSIRITVPSDKGELSVTAAVGVALGRQGSDLDRLLSLADAAMYLDKAALQTDVRAEQPTPIHL